MRQRLRSALRIALKGHEDAAVAALRSALGAIDNAEAVEQRTSPRAALGAGAADVERRELSEEDLLRVLAGEITDRLDAAADYQHLGRLEEAARLRAEAAALVAAAGMESGAP